MNKYKETFGVDISKDVFDVHASKKGHDQYKNDETGFKKYLEELPKGSLVVMEATGYYHYRLAQFLYKNGVLVSVVNPLSIKRFIQMKLSKVKTDKSDAKAICEYALIERGSYLQCLDRHPERMFTVVPVIGYLFKTTNGNQEQDTWGSSFRYTLKVCLSFLDTQQETAK
ncbi:IS110 family transposase [Zobellia nedashkovskayae]